MAKFAYYENNKYWWFHFFLVLAYTKDKPKAREEFMTLFNVRLHTLGYFEDKEIYTYGTK